MIEYGRAPVNCIKGAHDMEPEDKYKAHNSDIIAWTAPDEDKARGEAEIAAWFTRAVGTGISVYVLNKMTSSKE